LSLIIHDISFMTICIYFLVLKMADDRRAMYDGFCKKSAYSVEWVQIVKEFLNKAFVGGHRVAKYPYTIYQNYRFLTQDEVQVHL
jgi:hypothetical protein